MRAREGIRERARHEPTIGDELAMLGDDDLVEMMNLQEEDTGIPGTIFVSTAMGSHGPRVKYFVKTGRGQPSFSVSISDAPIVLASSLSQREVSRVAPIVVEWVKLNRVAVLRFWNEGETFSVRDMVEFVAALRKVHL